MAMRVSGLYSGMDTESIIADLVAVRQTKVDDLKKLQKGVVIDGFKTSPCKVKIKNFNKGRKTQ